MDLSCPSCAAVDVRRVSLVYREGTTMVDQRTGGAGVGLAGGRLGVGVFGSRTQGTNKTLLARDLAPPQAMKLSGWATIGVIAGLVLYFAGIANLNAGIFFGVLLAVASARYLWRQNQWNQTELPSLYNQWESSFMCSRCGVVFVPGGAKRETAPKPSIHELSRGSLITMGVAAIAGVVIGSVNGASETARNLAVSAAKRQTDSASALQLMAMLRVPATRTTANLFRFEDLVHGSHISIAHDSLHLRAVSRHLDSADALLRSARQGWEHATPAREQINAVYSPLTAKQQERRAQLVRTILHQDSLARRARRAAERAPVKSALVKTREPIGLSLAQATGDLGVELQRSSNVDGLPRWLGTQRLVVVEVIGDEASISSVTLMLGVANDDGGASVADALTAATQLVRNCAPDWSEGPDWARQSMARARSAAVSTVRNGKRFRMKSTPLGMVLFTVEHT